MAGTRTLIIQECRPIHTGRSRTGADYTIYDITAVREDYTPLPDQMKLRSFEELPLHVPTLFRIEKKELSSGPSFTLSPVRRS